MVYCIHVGTLYVIKLKKFKSYYRQDSKSGNLFSGQKTYNVLYIYTVYTNRSKTKYYKKHHIKKVKVK